MGQGINMMYFYRKFLQFNDLVFDEVDMLSADSSPASFRTNGTPRNRGGDYSPSKSPWGIPDSTNVSMTIKLNLKKLPCEMRKYYRNFAVTQLTKEGKLWAIQGDTLVWAFAKLTSIDEVIDDKKFLVEFDVSFYLPEGVWHKADKQRTFLQPYDRCEYLDCYKYKDVDPCATDCCGCETNEGGCECCDCVEEDYALCFHKEDLDGFYAKCDNPYHIVYDCAAAESFFGESLTNPMGQRFCTDCGVIAGTLYSDTDIPTQGIKIRIHGTVKNPSITINGVTNTINGEYTDLIIHEDGEITSDCDRVSIDKWIKPLGQEYGWTIYPGNNRILIHPNVCCGVVCAYIEVDSLTI